MILNVEHWLPGQYIITGLILGMRIANERRRHKVAPFLIGWAQT